MELIKGQTVIVLDVSNYKSEYIGEVDPPFRAEVIEIYDHEVVVIREDDLKKFEIYDWQILECFDDKAIKEMVSIQKWEKDGGQTFETVRREVYEDGYHQVFEEGVGPINPGQLLINETDSQG